MSIRQQLIESLIDDVTPRIKKSGNAEGELLKYANEQNYSPAMLEALGQLFNTAKTLSFLDKSANRGGDFSLVDVPSMVNKYLEVPATKSATRYSQWQDEAGKRDDELINMAPTDVQTSFPCDLFSAGGTVNEDDGWVPAATLSETAGMLGTKLASTHIDREAKKAEIIQLNQSIFDADMDCVQLLKKWASKFRQNPDMSFAELEADALLTHGELARPVLEKMARYLEVGHIKVARATGPGPERLIHDQFAFLGDLTVLLEKTAKIAGWHQSLDAATQAIARVVPGEGDEWVENFFKPATSVAGKSKSTGGRPDNHEDFEPGVPTDSYRGPKSNSRKDNKPGGHRDGPADAMKEPKPRTGPVKVEETGLDLSKLSDPKAVKDSPFATVPNMVFDAAKPVKDIYVKQLQDMLGKGWNRDQEHIDTELHDTKSQAMLQNLLLTDEVLAEADPDAVVNAYNTFRQASPQLANDPNVMRVALRSAVQHQGIDPFTIKGFSDTESARQKVDDSNHRQDEARYRTGLGGKKTKEPGKGSDAD